MKQLRNLPSRRDQRGALAIIVGLTIAVLIGFAGLALDGGRLYVNKTELQNAADACALAASFELTGAPNIPASRFPIAEDSGKLLATRNRVGFQGGFIAAADVTVQFASALNAGSWLSASSNPSASSKYVRCTLAETGITPWFMQVLGFGNSSVQALATATPTPAHSSMGASLSLSPTASTA